MELLKVRFVALSALKAIISSGEARTMQLDCPITRPLLESMKLDADRSRDPVLIVLKRALFCKAYFLQSENKPIPTVSISSSFVEYTHESVVISFMIAN